MTSPFLASVRKEFEYNKSLGDRTFPQLTDGQLFQRVDEESNSIAIIVNHLWGNMLSRWTDVLTSDGEKEWRKRDHEFESVITTREELLAKWEEGWSTLFAALDTINETNIESTIYIRNQAHTVIEAVHRQLGHYSYHVGQLVLLARSMKGADWQSLSIPRGQSTTFNADKFARGKHGGHYTDDLK